MVTSQLIYVTTVELYAMKNSDIKLVSQKKESPAGTYLLVNQKTRICTHSKQLILDVQKQFIAIQCAKCRTLWELTGDE